MTRLRSLHPLIRLHGCLWHISARTRLPVIAGGPLSESLTLSMSRNWSGLRFTAHVDSTLGHRNGPSSPTSLRNCGIATRIAPPVTRNAPLTARKCGYGRWAMGNSHEGPYCKDCIQLWGLCCECARQKQ